MRILIILTSLFWCLTQTQAAQPARLGLQIAPKVGATVPLSDLGVVMAGSVELGFDLVTLKELLGNLVVPGISVEFSYLEPGLKGTQNDPAVGDYRYTLWQRIMILSIDALCTFELGDWHPYGGIGWGIYFLHANMHAFELTNTEDQMMSGLQARVGLGYELGIGDLFAEIRYHDVGLEFLITGDSNARGITTAAGYRFRF
jgi:hypothetical protein